MSLREQAFRGVRWTALSSLVRIGLTLVQVVVLARLLTPADFGLMALAASLLALLETFADAGVSNAIIHRQETDPGRLSSLYWLNVATGAGIALLLALASPLLAAFYDAPLLQPLLLAGALHLVASASWQQLLVRAEMELRFGALAATQVPACAAGVAVSLLVAAQGGGALALAAGLLAQSVTAAGLGWLLLARGWRPSLRLRPGEIRPHLAFGAYTVANSLVNSVSSQVDVLVGGRMLQPQALGEYSVSRNLCLQVGTTLNPVVTRVGLPLLARARSDPALLKDVYLQAVRMTASVNFPLYAGLALFAPEVVALLLGPQWDAAVPLLRLFALWGALRALINPVGALLLACGRADLSLWWNLGLLACIVPAAFAGGHYGPWGLAIAVTSLVALALAPHWFLLVRPLCGAGAGEYAQSAGTPLLLSLAALLPAAAASLPMEGMAARLAMGLVTGAAAYLALSAVFNRKWLEALRGLLRLGR
jgi:O-antigen/teichoic acid export membrane protein